MSLPYRFESEELLELALTHSSTAAGRHNERLEFLGDAALDLIVADELFRRHPDLPEGVLTQLKASVVSRDALAAAARALALEERARVGAGLSKRALSRAVLANLYEALVGAVYLDGGLEAARGFVDRTLAGALHEAYERRQAPNPKQELQELCQRRWGAPPEYPLLESRGEAHARAFLVRAEVDGRAFPPAWGRTVREAERWAAFEALLVLAEEEA